MPHASRPPAFPLKETHKKEKFRNGSQPKIATMWLTSLGRVRVVSGAKVVFGWMHDDSSANDAALSEERNDVVGVRCRHYTMLVG